MRELSSLDLKELTDLLVSMGEKPFRAKQVFEWIHVHRVSSFDEMTNLPKALRAKLTAGYTLSALRTVTVQTSRIDGTKKYLFETHDGQLIESVRMVYRYGASVCVSSQIGCRMGCGFCASTTDGLVRSLNAGEMLSQVYRIHADTGTRVSHVVVMGMGEPFDNYDALIRFLRLLTAPEGYGLSVRNITVSTCGIVPRIYDFAAEGLGVTLALSLHAPDQETRERMMPAAKAYPLPEVIEACVYYARTSGRRVTAEYAMARGVNDSDRHADRLAHLLKGTGIHVNLIPVNPVRGKAFSQSSDKALSRFKNRLENYGINVTIRRELGRDIDGACGQLRRRYGENQTE